MFAKLAFRNIRRQIRSYLIYFVTIAMTVALMFAVNNLSYSDRVRQLADVSDDMGTMFTMVTILACLVTALVLSYATGFMLKLRRKEFGMYLTLGMTRRNIQTLFVCETWILSALALLVGMGVGLVLYQLAAALFASILEIPFAVSAYSAKAILITVAVSLALFLLSSLASLRYLKKVTVTELLKEEPAEKTEKHPVLWCGLSLVTLAGLIASLIITYQSLMAAFRAEESMGLMVMLVVDLVMVFLSHFTLSRTLAGLLLRSRKLKSRGTNTVVLRGLSGKMTMNSLLIGALATLLVFAIAMSNVALGEKIHSRYSLDLECPYDVQAMFDLSEEHGISMEEGKGIIETYSPITEEFEFRLYTTGETTICSSIEGYDVMGWTDTFMPLSQFNALLTGCGREPITLENQYLVVASAPDILNSDFSAKHVTLGGETYTWAESSAGYPDFVRKWFYFVVPDEAVRGMTVSDQCAVYTLENQRPDAQALVDALMYYRETEDGLEDASDYRVREYYRLYANANAGTLIIGTLYVSTVFVCMALAILSIKILSTLPDERRRFAVLYRLGAEETMQKKALLQQTGAFFLMPFALPLLLTVPFGLIFGKVYEIWNFTGLSGQHAMVIALLISLTVAGVYALYFLITYRIACDHVICRSGSAVA